MSKPGREDVEEAISFVEKKGHGEVVIKIINGVIHLIATTQRKIVDNKEVK